MSKGKCKTQKDQHDYLDAWSGTIFDENEPLTWDQVTAMLDNVFGPGTSDKLTLED